MIQENVVQPVYFRNSNARDNEKTTALRLQVNNRLYANVILLLNSLPKPRWPSMKGKIPKDKEAVEDEDDFLLCCCSASVNQKSDLGLTTLYIAVSLCDYKMVKILFSIEADPFIECSNGKTLLTLICYLEMFSISLCVNIIQLLLRNVLNFLEFIISFIYFISKGK